MTIGSGEWALPATLALPVGPNKSFKDLASGLASPGIAVLRYDKRTKVHRAKVAALKDLTVEEEVIDDVVGATHREH